MTEVQTPTEAFNLLKCFHQMSISIHLCRSNFLTFLKDKFFCFNEKQQLMENECFEREPFWFGCYEGKMISLFNGLQMAAHTSIFNL